ncbi:TPA: hypothetical protein N0F65_000423 [Lagenidium giganteum]|uniref:Uncharacterized protein n=1 Tax=Lagenidium giganteum TaxID=4803 RepID=A0AAV2YJV5_9STRA|nr:TPA: hypothetical protein N0F65_000423 [Lagenidium giganteum]
MGYYARVLAPESRALTAFILPFGKFRFCRLHFGIATAPTNFKPLWLACSKTSNMCQCISMTCSLCRPRSQITSNT